MADIQIPNPKTRQKHGNVLSAPATEIMEKEES